MKNSCCQQFPVYRFVTFLLYNNKQAVTGLVHLTSHLISCFNSRSIRQDYSLQIEQVIWPRVYEQIYILIVKCQLSSVSFLPPFIPLVKKKKNKRNPLTKSVTRSNSCLLDGAEIRQGIHTFQCRVLFLFCHNLFSVFFVYMKRHFVLKRSMNDLKKEIELPFLLHICC